MLARMSKSLGGKKSRTGIPTHDAPEPAEGMATTAVLAPERSTIDGTHKREVYCFDVMDMMLKNIVNLKTTRWAFELFPEDKGYEEAPRVEEFFNDVNKKVEKTRFVANKDA